MEAATTPGKFEEEGFYSMATTIENLTGLEQLHDLLLAGQARAALTGGPILVSYTQPVPAVDPLDFFGQASRLFSAAFFWERAEEQFILAGGGEALVLEAAGTGRFDTVEKRWQVLREEALISGLDTGSRWGRG